MRPCLVPLIITATACAGLPQTTQSRIASAPDLPGVVEEARDSIVRIVRIDDPSRHPPLRTVIGTGFFVSRDGLVATANHVISGAPPDRLVAVPSSEFATELRHLQAFRIEVVARSAEWDLALIRVTSDRTFTPLRFEATSRVRLGQSAVVMGFPLADPLLTVIPAVVSSSGGHDTFPPARHTGLIKLDAHVNQGNSGSPVVSISSGRVIGVVTQKLGDNLDSIGIGFCVPADPLLDLLKKARNSE